MNVREIMTENPATLSADSTVEDAARLMKERDIGDVIVMKDGELCGILTDRDIVVRALAEHRDISKTPVDQICSHHLVTVSPDADVTAAVQLMRDHAIRRLPVVEEGKPVGIVSIGDLAVEREPQSALGHISASAPNR